MKNQEIINNFQDIDNLEHRYNWGAFLLGWFWGLFNNSYITLIQIPAVFIPYIGQWLSLGLAICFGIQGNKWALTKKQFKSKTDFITYQKLLACVGIIFQATFFIFVKIMFEMSALHPVGYDFSITTRLIKGLLTLLLIIYVITGVFIIKLINIKRHKG